MIEDIQALRQAARLTPDNENQDEKVWCIAAGNVNLIDDIAYKAIASKHSVKILFREHVILTDKRLNHRLVDVGVAKGEHDDHDSGDGQQDLDHGVAKGLLEFRPESRRLRVRDGVAAVGSAGLFHFLVVQTVKVHGMFFSFLCAWRKRKRLPFLFLRVIAYW